VVLLLYVHLSFLLLYLLMEQSLMNDQQQRLNHQIHYPISHLQFGIAVVGPHVVHLNLRFRYHLFVVYFLMMMMMVVV
jgi:hypothetical protein